jgi:hypothetical protein
VNPSKLFKSAPAKIIAAVAALAVVALLAAQITSQQGPPPQDVFSGAAMLDQNGEATIALPATITAQHTDFGYYVRTMGAPMPNLYLKSELQNGRFTVAGGTPGGQVMWELFALRKAP